MDTVMDIVIKQLRADGFIEAAMNGIPVETTPGFQVAEAVAEELSRLRAENKRLRDALEELRYACTDKALAMADAALAAGGE